MSDIKIEDNYLSSKEFEQVQDIFAPASDYSQNEIQKNMGSINWTLSPVINYSTGNESELHNYQLACLFFQSPDPRIGADPYFIQFNKFMFPFFFHKMQPRGLLRVKGNLQMRTTEIMEHGFHCDYPPHYSGAKTSIFYINSNDGYTEFKDGTKIESVRNRLVTFPHHMEHRGTTCTNKPFRLVLNFNYF